EHGPDVGHVHGLRPLSRRQRRGLCHPARDSGRRTRSQLELPPTPVRDSAFDSDSGTCQDNGAAVEWTQRSLTPGGSVTIGTGVSFTGSAVPQGGTVPTLSTLGLAALVLALALVGYLLAGRHSLGA